ncbi:MAG: HEAT repeat domain-containing protein, partial [Cellulosimicrobium funkei]
MTVREEHRAALRALDGDPAAVRAHLTAGSGLPGPRANLELLNAFADVAPADLVRALADDPDEYLRCCGTCGLGRLVVEAPADARAEPTDQ